VFSSSQDDTIQNIIKYLRNRDYMSGVERSQHRVKQTAEVFTPTPLVQEILDQLPQEVFTDPTKTFLDPTCGDGQFLSEVIIRKMENGSSYEQALSTTYGADLMRDNVRECIKRLYMVDDSAITELCGNNVPKSWRTDGLKCVYKVNGKLCNIVCADGLVYDYSFGESSSTEIDTDPVDAEEPFGIQLFSFQ
jgi:hypothetical protein